MITNTMYEQHNIPLALDLYYTNLCRSVPWESYSHPEGCIHGISFSITNNLYCVSGYDVSKHFLLTTLILGYHIVNTIVLHTRYYIIHIILIIYTHIAAYKAQLKPHNQPSMCTIKGLL